MADKGFNPFDPEAMTKWMRDMPFADMMPKVPQMDPQAMMQMQSRNMEAFQAANSAAAEAYKDLFAKQVEVFQTMLKEARERAGGSMDAEGQQKMMAEAMERAMAHMTELAQEAQAANSKAWEIVSARMKESLAEIESMAKKT